MPERTDHNSPDEVRRTRQKSVHPGLWMRSVQFSGLHRILHRVASFPDGIRVKNLNRLIVEHRDYWTGRGEPSNTTLYHCRNTLLQLGALRRLGQVLVVANENPHVAALLDIPPDQGDSLPLTACNGFSALVLKNNDCYENFFRLFLPTQTAPSVDQFRTQARSVVWNQNHDAGQQAYELRSDSSGDVITLSAPIPIRSILYGVRDWACKQLRLTDEFFDVGRGSVIFPVRHPENECDSAAVYDLLLDSPTDESEWTTVSIRELLSAFCERYGYPVHFLFDGIRRFAQSHSGFVSLIPTIQEFATITASSRNRAKFELISAFHDTGGRVISHIRFHRSLRELHDGQKENRKEVKRSK